MLTPGTRETRSAACLLAACSIAAAAIDTDVPLVAAWRAGAASWTRTQRTKYADDRSSS